MSRGKDAHYSPLGVSKRLAELLPGGAHLVVFDPAIGGGALLDAAQEVLGAGSSFSGADVDPAVVRVTRRQREGWLVSIGDALNSHSRARSAAWRRAADKGVDVVLMNPPFSYRGHGGPRVQYEGEDIRATPAMAFVATALDVLAPRVGLFAVLPRGAIDGERDRALWSLIQRRYAVTVHGELPRGSFSTATATTVLVSIRSDARSNLLLPAAAPDVFLGRGGCRCVEVVRGRVPVSRFVAAGPGLVPWVHSRDVRDGRISTVLTDLPRELVSRAPLVVLPRVGKFDMGKIAGLNRTRVVLSDCMFGLRPVGGEIGSLFNDIASQVALLERQYFGTGAPHMTTRRLLGFLRTVGYSPRHVRADADPSSCWCSSEESPQTDGQHATKAQLM